MPGIEDYQKWVEQAKSLIGDTGDQALYEKRNNQVASVLLELQAKGSKAHVPIFDEYKRLAGEAQSAQKANDKKKVKQINENLKDLKDRAKKALADHDAWRAKVDAAEKKWIVETAKLTETLTKEAQERVQKLRLQSASVAFITEDSDRLYDGLRKALAELPPNGDLSKLASQYEAALAAFAKSNRALDDRQFAAVCNAQVQREAKVAAEREKQQKDVELLQKKRELDVSLRDLEDVGVDSANIASLRKRVGVKTIPEAEQLFKDIAKSKADHEAVQKTKIKALSDQLKTLSASIEAKKKELRGNEKAVKALDDLGTEAAQLIKLGESNNPEALQGAQMLAKRIERIVKTTEADSGVAKLYSDIDAMKKILGDKDLQTFFDAKANQLQDRLKKLSDDVDVFDLPASESELGAIRVLADEIVKEKDKLLGWQAGVRKWMESVRGMAGELKAMVKGRGSAVEKAFGNLGDFMTGKTLKITVLLKDIEDTYQQPGADQTTIEAKRTEVNARIRALMQALADPKADAAGALDSEFKDATAELKSREDDKKAEEKKHEDFKKELETLLADIEKSREAVKTKKGPQAELDSLKKMAGLAKTMEKNGDREGALKQIEIVRKRLKKVGENPGGFAVYSTEELGQAAARWQSALAAVQKDLDALAAEASAVAKTAGKSQDQITNKIKAALAGFSQDAFKSAAKLIDETAPLAERKKIREEVLVQVRRHQSMLQNDPVLDLVRTSPFKVRVSTLPIRQALDGLELNALRAVPGE
jgi:hypothetical protein